MSNKKELAIIFLIIFVNLIGFGIVIPLLPFYADTVGGTEFQIGLLFASYSICQIVASPILGSLSDRIGRRPVLLLSLLGTVASFALLAVANTLFLLFAARIIDGLSGGNISTARAYISDITEKKDRAKAYGIIGAAFGLGFIFGPAMAGLLRGISVAAPAWGAAILAGIAFILTFLYLSEVRERRTTARRNPWGDVPRLLSQPVLGRLLTVDFLYWAAFAVYQTTFALFAERRFGWGIAEVGYVLTFAGFIGAVVQGGLVGRVVKKLGEKRTMVAGLILSAIGLGSAAFVYSWPLFVLAIIPASVGAGLANPTVVALISQYSRQDEQGRVQGVSSALESSGRAVGPIWGNGFLGAFGEGIAYGSAAIVLGLVALLGFTVSDRAVEPKRAGPADTNPVETPAR